MMAHRHKDGIGRPCLRLREGIGSPVVDRCFRDCLGRKYREFAAGSPRVLGLDQHFFMH